MHLSFREALGPCELLDEFLDRSDLILALIVMNLRSLEYISRRMVNGLLHYYMWDLRHVVVVTEVFVFAFSVAELA